MCDGPQMKKDTESVILSSSWLSKFLTEDIGVQHKFLDLLRILIMVVEISYLILQHAAFDLSACTCELLTI